MPNSGDDGELTRAGCVVTFLSFAVTVGVAVPIVCSLASIQPPLPRMVIIAAPLIVGALFNAVVTYLLRLVGIRTWAKPDQDHLQPDESDDASVHHR
jgi:hypothetical protein